MTRITSLPATLTRLGVVLSPDGSNCEADGVLNPASVRDREGNLLLYPRRVAPGNVSRIGLVKVSHAGDGVGSFERLGNALVPETPDETNGTDRDFGTEDARATFVPVLGKYLMGYTSYGTPGARISFAWSDDAYDWHRIGVAKFPSRYRLPLSDKDVAVFPEPVLSPKGVLCIAFYHRPMNHIEPQENEGAIPAILRAAPNKRQSIRIAYVPLADILKDISAICRPTESVRVMSPDDSTFGRVKLGGGTVPVRIAEGWLSVFHGVDAIDHGGGVFKMRYSAGLVVHDAEQPHKVRFRSRTPILAPETPDELSGVVNNVVFPTALDARPDLGERVFDIYYGMADYKIGLARLELPTALR